MCIPMACVALGLFTSTERCAVGPGAQSGTRNYFSANTAAS
jgi:hypothetical protein